MKGLGATKLDGIRIQMILNGTEHNRWVGPKSAEQNLVQEK